MFLFSPKEIAYEFCNTGIAKSQMDTKRFALLAVLGGTFIALGGLLTVIVAGGMPEVAATNPGLVKFVAGCIFPVGLIMVTIAGADLFTSDCTGVVLPFLERKITISAVCKVLAISYIFNFVGAQFIAYFMSASVGLFDADPWRAYLHNLAYSKTSQDFYTVFMKGIGANWLVCLGTWMGYAGKDVVSKSVGIWIPVMMFVTLGYEHSIANMFFVPAAIYSGATLEWSQFIVSNLIPATLGNVLGGALLVATVYWYIYMKK